MLFMFAPLVASHARPNILLLVSDDLGYNEIEPMNKTRGLVTPHLGWLASQGVTLTSYYVAPMVSASARSCPSGIAFPAPMSMFTPDE